MNFEVRTLTEDEWSLWDDFVDESPRGTIFHKSYFLKESGGRVIIYGCFIGGELYAGIPITYKLKFGVKIASRLGQTLYGGILFKQRYCKYAKKLTAEKEVSRQIAQRLKADFHIIMFGYSPGPVDLQPFIWEGFSTSIQYTYIIELRSTIDDIWKGMLESTQRSIRKAKKDGIKIIQSDDFNQMFKLTQKTYKRQRKQFSSRYMAFSRNEVLTQRKQCKSFLAENNTGEFIAGVYIAWDNKRSYYLLGGYDFEKSHYGASALAMWEAIKFTKDQLGLQEFDFAGSMIPQIERFFRGFGGQLTTRHSIKWVKPYLRPTLFAYELAGLISQ